MTTYKTGNPIGSTAVKDLYDNAENLDTLVNDRTQESHPDRLGQQRKTWHGMEQDFNTSQIDRQNRFNNFIASSGYQFLGDYAAGLEFTEYNQLVRDENGEFWRLSGQAELPYTTTGSGIPEGDALVPAGDAVLRQELAAENGSLRVRGAVTYVDTVGDLQALPVSSLTSGQQVSVQGFWTGTRLGGRVFEWNSAEPKSNHDGGDVIDPLKISELVSPQNFGSYYEANGDGVGCWVAVADNGAAFLDIANYGAGTSEVSSEILNKIFAIASKQKRTPVSYHDFYLVGEGCFLKSGFISHGVISIDKSTQDGVPFTFEDDHIVDEDFSLISAYSTAGSRDLSEALSAYPDYILLLASSDVICNRYVSSGNTQYRKTDNNRITSAGNLCRPLEHTYHSATKFQLRKSDPSEIKITLHFVGDPGDSLEDLGTAVAIQRSYVKADVNITNSTFPYKPIMTGCFVSYCGMTEVTGDISGTDTPSLGYSFLAMYTYGITFREVATSNTRKSVDMTFATDTRVIGGYHEAQIASHLSYGLLIDGATCYGYSTSGGETQSVIEIVGKDLKVVNNKLYSGPILNTRFVNVRDDIPIRSGYLIVEGNQCFESSTANNSVPIIARVWSMEFDYGANLGMFDEIIVRNNTVKNIITNIEGSTALTLNNINTINPAEWPKRVVLSGNVGSTPTSVHNCYFTMTSDTNTPTPYRASGSLFLDNVNLVRLAIKGATGGYSLNIKDIEGGVFANHTAKDIRVSGGTINYFQFLNPEPGVTPPPGKLVWITDCIVDPLSMFNYHDVGFCFSRNEFKGVPQIPSQSYIALSSGNFGASSGSFPLDGVYDNSGG